MFFTPLFCFAVLLAAHLSIICYNHPVWLQLQSKCCKQVSEFCVCLFSFFFYSYLYSPLLINNTEKGIWLFFFSHTNCIPLFPFFFSSAVSAIIYFFFSFFPCSLPKRFVFSCSKPLNYSSYLEQPLLFCCCRGATVDQVLRFFFFIIVITTLGRNLLFALICFFFLSLSL